MTRLKKWREPASGLPSAFRLHDEALLSWSTSLLEHFSPGAHLSQSFSLLELLSTLEALHSRCSLLSGFLGTKEDKLKMKVDMLMVDSKKPGQGFKMKEKESEKGCACMVHSSNPAPYSR